MRNRRLQDWFIILMLGAIIMGGHCADWRIQRKVIKLEKRIEQIESKEQK